MLPHVLSGVLVSLLWCTVRGQTWCVAISRAWDVTQLLFRCGKNYMSNETVVEPGGQFTFPASSSTPLLAFRCGPSIRPYIADDSSSPAGILIDSSVTYSNISGAQAINLPPSISGSDQLSVTVSINGKTIAQGNVPLNVSKYELPFSLLGLQAQAEPYNISCTATYATSMQSSPAPRNAKLYIPILPSWLELFSTYGTKHTRHVHHVRSSSAQTFQTSASLSYLPNPTQGSITKMDLRTGALLAKPANSSGGYDTVFPIGFYTMFDGYLASNLSNLDQLKAQG